MHVLCERRSPNAAAFGDLPQAAAFGDLPQAIETVRTLTPKNILRLCMDIIPTKAKIFLTITSRRKQMALWTLVGPQSVHRSTVSSVDVIPLPNIFY